MSDLKRIEEKGLPSGGAWHLITCEYPPQMGGVSDYTRVVAEGLSEAGEAIDTACENCHLKYWYPNGGPPAGPVLSPREIGVRPSEAAKPAPPATQQPAPTGKK